MIIGAGETAELTAQALAGAHAGEAGGSHGVKTVFVANRHAARARSVAARFGGSVVSLDSLPAQLEVADIVVASTSSPHPIVGSEELALVMRARENRPLVVIDLAVPRDVDPACADLPGVTLYDIDDLQAVVGRTLAVRSGEARSADAIVEEEIQRFAGFLGGMEVLPTVAALRAHAGTIVDQVLAENAGKWESASPRDLNRVDAIARAAVNRLLHEPTIRLRAMGAGSSHGRLALLRELFGLERGDESDEGSDNVRSLGA